MGCIKPAGVKKHDIKIDTKTGTWMSLDVSPDGKTIAFDLLGDIYTMPINGGRATAIAAGMAWEIQPPVFTGRQADCVHI